MLELFMEATQGGTMEGFFKLISYFRTQSEPAYCGLATLAMVLNVLSIDPGRKWKGPWRWFDESMLDCCEPLEKVKDEGISFGKVVCLARCAGAKVEAFRTNQTCIDEFRKHVLTCSTSDTCHTGAGHFLPIGGYHAGSDMIEKLRTSVGKYPQGASPKNSCSVTNDYENKSSSDMCSGVFGLEKSRVTEIKKYEEMFSCMISKAATLDVICNGEGANKWDVVQLVSQTIYLSLVKHCLQMFAELQMLTPLVVIREVYFVRYSKQLSVNTWAIADVSIDNVGKNIDASLARCRKRPSGCIIEDKSNGYCKDTRCIPTIEMDFVLWALWMTTILLEVHLSFKPGVR